VKNLIGVDYIGIGSDYDGVPQMPIALEDVSQYPNLFDLLGEDGHGWEPWTKEELKKLAGLNLIRVFKEVEEVRDMLKSVENIIDEPIPYADVLEETKSENSCWENLKKFDYLAIQRLNRDFLPAEVNGLW
jgi:membrane dipeptidase